MLTRNEQFLQMDKIISVDGKRKSTCRRPRKERFYVHAARKRMIRVRPRRTIEKLHPRLRIRGHEGKPGVRLTPIDRPGEDREVGREREERGGRRSFQNDKRDEEAQRNGFGTGVVFGARGWSDRWKVLRDEGGGCQGNALPASAYFSSARALGSIQHHREFPDQTHPLDTRSHPRLPTYPSSISFSILRRVRFIRYPPAIFLFVSSSTPLPLRSTSLLPLSPFCLLNLYPSPSYRSF